MYGVRKILARSAQKPRPVARIIGQCDIKIWGTSSYVRWTRAFKRYEVKDIGDETTLIHEDAPSVVLGHQNYVVDETLIKALIETPDIILVLEKNNQLLPIAAHCQTDNFAATVQLLKLSPLNPEAAAALGLKVVKPSDLTSSYNRSLRKRADPYIFSLPDDSMDLIEKRMFKGVYKGVTDFVTKYVWPPLARPVTRWASQANITPNMVTSVSLIFVLLTMWLFVEGHFWLGMITAWIMTFLDTVDGKLARVTMTSSPLGNIFDHGIDHIHPPFWWWAWWQGVITLKPELLQSTGWWFALWAVLLSYLAGRILEGWFLWRHKIQIHVWRPIDSFFRLIVARRNPNLVILMIGLALGSPEIAFYALAAWSIFCVLFHIYQSVSAENFRSQHDHITSWLSERNS
ncbi:MAG: CDP-alcohol phosphatidyltransferase family protein [Alphaproteobacteria bacterium]|nr:CDP-alcohol phosphatidyltransferase family protein [Alphaproteobacteria bacterium]